MLVEESERNKHVTDLERDISINALELNERLARDIMTPRTEIVHMDLGKSFEENLLLALDSKHTRFPIREGTLDNVPGIIHIKDLLRVVHSKTPTDLLKIARQPLWIPEIQPLDEVLRAFLQKQAHMGLVVDENGVLTGMLTLDDVLEEIVGEIRDEFDVHDEERFRTVGEDEFLVEGKFPLYELGEFIPDMELEMANVSTITGYITSKLNRLPIEEDVVEIEDSHYEAKVEKVDGRRVTQVRIRKKSAVPATEANTSSGD
jgi:CBS domain containing-hemolysin-like protein